VYIGLTCQNVERRWRHGLGYKGSSYFYNAIQKYGWDNFIHEIVKDNLTKEEALKLEAELIQKYKAQNEDYGYNLESGGSAPTHSDVTKKILSAKLKGRTFTEEWKTNMRKAFETRPGREWAEESKEKLRQSKLGHKVSDETRNKLRQAFGKSVLCIELNQTFNSLTDAASFIGLDKTSISAVIHGRNKTAGGYHWKLV
jgi:group I intron endonuclease